MDSVLIARWIGGAPTIPILILDASSVAVARERVREVARTQGMNEEQVGGLAVTVSELGHNHLAHARDGEIAVLPVERDGVRGVEIVAVDRGPGIADPTAAIEGVVANPAGLGVGLRGAMAFADEVDFDIRQREGMCVRARKYAQRVGRRREVAILGRPCVDFGLSGDDAAFFRTPRGLVLTIADGLGHGFEAREASSRAMAVATTMIGSSPAQVLASVDTALLGTRGAVMALADVDEGSCVMHHGCVGNITTRLCSSSASHALGGTSFVLGARGSRGRTFPQEDRNLGPGDVLVMTSDGVRSAMRIEGVDAGILRRHPLVIAHHIMRSFARDGDDVTILVAS
jgi:anti-sigma regulatory factor (Ser/Thr protein kinase)